MQLFVLAIERSAYSDEFGIYEFGSLFKGHGDGIWIEATVFAIASFIWTSLLYLISTFVLSRFKKEGLWGYVLICGGLSLGFLFLDRAEYEAFFLLIWGVTAGAIWWWTHRRQVIQADLASSMPRAFKVLLLVGLILNAFSFYNGWPMDHFAHLDFDDVLKNREIGSHIEGGVIAGDEVLLFNSDGSLFAFDRNNWVSRLLKAKTVIDVEKAAEQIWVLSATKLPIEMDYEDEFPPGEFTLSLFRNRKIENIVKLRFAKGERPIALAIYDSKPVVVAQRAILFFDQDYLKWDRVTLDKPIGGEQAIWGWVSDAIVSDDGKYLYVGINAGEFGGDLFSIELDNATIEWVGEGSGSKDCSFGDLHPCTAITGLTNSPFKPGCLVRSEAISHWSTFGQLSEVCGNEVEVLYSKSRNPPIKTIAGYIRTLRYQHAPLQVHEPFFDLAKTNHGNLWSVSYTWLYQMQENDWVKRKRLDYRKHGDIWIGAKTPDSLAILTRRNSQHSLAGPTPLLIQ